MPCQYAALNTVVEIVWQSLDKSPLCPSSCVVLLLFHQASMCFSLHLSFCFVLFGCVMSMSAVPYTTCSSTAAVQTRTTILLCHLSLCLHFMAAFPRMVLANSLPILDGIARASLFFFFFFFFFFFADTCICCILLAIVTVTLKSVDGQPR